MGQHRTNPGQWFGIKAVCHPSGLEVHSGLEQVSGSDVLKGILLKLGDRAMSQGVQEVIGKIAHPGAFIFYSEISSFNLKGHGRKYKSHMHF